MKHPLFASNCHNGFNGFAINVVVRSIRKPACCYKLSDIFQNKKYYRYKTTILAYKEFLTNPSHTNKRELPLNCSCYIGRYQTPDL